MRCFPQLRKELDNEWGMRVKTSTKYGSLESHTFELFAVAWTTAARITTSQPGWAGAKTKLFHIFKKTSWRGSAYNKNGTMVHQWFVYLKGSGGIWLGEDGNMYRANQASTGQFYRIDIVKAILSRREGSRHHYVERLIQALDAIQP